MNADIFNGGPEAIVSEVVTNSNHEQPSPRLDEILSIIPESLLASATFKKILADLCKEDEDELEKMAEAKDYLTYITNRTERLKRHL